MVETAGNPVARSASNSPTRSTVRASLIGSQDRVACKLTRPERASCSLMLLLPQSITNCVPIIQLEWPDNVRKKPCVRQDIGILDALERQDRTADRHGVAELDQRGLAEVAVPVEADEEARAPDLGEHRVLEGAVIVDRIG